MAKLTSLKKKNFQEILLQYSLGEYLSSKHIWWAFGNTVYILRTTQGKYVLKVFENSDPEFIKYQIKIINFCAKKNLPVVEIVKTNQNQNLLVYHNHRIQIQKYIKGTYPKKMNQKTIKDIAQKQALMNKNLLELKLKNKHTWEPDHQFKKINFSNKKFQNFNAPEEDYQLTKDLKKINKHKLRKGVIHGDFNQSNLLIYQSKLKAILDWDDVHEDYLIQELAVFIAHSFVGEKIDLNIKIYLKEYQKILKLNFEEQKALYYFIKKRYFGAVSWLALQIRKHQDRKTELEKSINRLVKQYQSFNKLSLKDFLNLF